jgi:hypothetical protein
MLSLFCTRPTDLPTQVKDQTVMSLKRNLLYRVMEDKGHMLVAYGKTSLPRKTMAALKRQEPKHIEALR